MIWGFTFQHNLWYPKITRPDQDSGGDGASHQQIPAAVGARRRASRAWQPYYHTCPRLHKVQLAPCLWQRRWRLVFSQHWTKIRPICSPRWSCACTDTLTVAQDHMLLTRDILGYPNLFIDILGQPLISKVIPFSAGQWRFKQESLDQHLESWPHQ